jgi:hypothetical protein
LILRGRIWTASTSVDSLALGQPELLEEVEGLRVEVVAGAGLALLPVVVVGARDLGVDVKVLQTPLGIFCLEHH